MTFCHINHISPHMTTYYYSKIVNMYVKLVICWNMSYICWVLSCVWREFEEDWSLFGRAVVFWPLDGAVGLDLHTSVVITTSWKWSQVWQWWRWWRWCTFHLLPQVLRCRRCLVHCSKFLLTAHVSQCVHI